MKPFKRLNISRFATPRRQRLWLIIMAISILGMIDFPARNLLGSTQVWKWIDLLTISALKSTLLMALIVFCGRLKYLSVATKTILAVYTAICVFNGVTYWFYDMGISIKLITVIGQTNVNEFREFVQTVPQSLLWALSQPALYLTVGGFVVMMVVCGKIRPKPFVISALSLSAVGFVILVSSIISLPEGRSGFFATFRLARSTMRAYNDYELLMHGLGKLSDLPAAATVESDAAVDVVMVVGESASRERLSLYGYPLATSPKLDTIKDSLIVFDDVIGTSTATIANMRRILTFLNDTDDDADWSQSPMLVALMNQAGYSTAWLSNQEKYGLWGNTTAIMVSMADDVRYLSGIDNSDVMLQNFDEVLLPALDETLRRNAGATFAGLHLIGSHTLYNRRYPADFAVFNRDSVLRLSVHQDLSNSQAQTVAEYLNSLRYTDYILSRVVDMVSRRERPTAMIYFSDHGENVYDDGEDCVGRDREHVKVPLVLYLNDEFKARYPELVERLRNSRHRSMTTAGIPHLVCALTGTRYQMYADSLDVTSPAYIERPRYVDGNLWEFDE